MIVDGKSIAADIYREVGEKIKQLGRAPRLLVLTAAPNAETKKYLSLKQRKAAALGIEIVVEEFRAEVSTIEAVAFIERAKEGYDGLVVQLPFPPQVDIEAVLAKIPAAADVDAINWQGGDERILPPVVGAIKEIAVRHKVGFADKKVVVVGRGRLVGAPAALWAAAQSAAGVTVIDRDTPDSDDILRSADIIISGAGSPGLITPEKIKDGAIVFDAGTSEEGGVLKGDADPACARKAALFTPVPGGIGPITIAVLLRNLVLIAELS